MAEDKRRLGAGRWDGHCDGLGGVVLAGHGGHDGHGGYRGHDGQDGHGGYRGPAGCSSRCTGWVDCWSVWN